MRLVFQMYLVQKELEKNSKQTCNHLVICISKDICICAIFAFFSYLFTYYSLPLLSALSLSLSIASLSSHLPYHKLARVACMQAHIALVSLYRTLMPLLLLQANQDATSHFSVSVRVTVRVYINVNVCACFGVRRLPTLFYKPFLRAPVIP